MQFSTSQDFPAGIDRLWAAFGHPEYPRNKYLALGASAVRLHRFEATARSIEVNLNRAVPARGLRLPAWAHALIGREQTLRHRTSWRRTGKSLITAELDIELLGLPVRAHGSGTIVEATPGTSHMRLVWRTVSTVPLVRGKVECLFADQVRAALDDDHEFTVRFLRGAPCERSGRR